ncbi:MAG: accessory gene regulator B family protein [Roseburia sp.]|nr:accessory gene regulator B family protein [Roseburia sp.]
MSKTEMTAADLAYQKKLRRYFLEAFLSESSKILLFLLIAIYTNLVKEYLAALLFLMLLRNHGGGLHFNHYISCLIVSFLFLYASILLACFWQPCRFILLLSLFICVIGGYFLVPVTSSNRPPATKQQIKHSKRSTVFIITTFFFLTCFCPLTKYLYIGFWTTVLHIFQLTLAHAKGGVGNA